MAASHGSGEPGPCGAVPPIHVHAAPRQIAGPGGIGQVDNFQAAGAVEDDLRVDDVPGQRDGQARLPAGPGRDMVQVPAGMAASELAEPGRALDTIPRRARCATAMELHGILLAGGLDHPDRTCPRAWSASHLDLRLRRLALRAGAAAVYALPPWTVTSANRPGRLERRDPACRILMLLVSSTNRLISQYRSIGNIRDNNLSGTGIARRILIVSTATWSPTGFRA